MSDTPRTDKVEAEGNRKSALLANYYLVLTFARQLERELAAEKALRKAAERALRNAGNYGE